jgi:Protein of Unknown function (DUF2604)
LPANHDNKTNLTIVVNGEPTVVEANPHAALHSVIGRALAQTGNTGQAEENWELRDASGLKLDLNRKISEFPPDVRLFLNLKAGVGG